VDDTEKRALRRPTALRVLPGRWHVLPHPAFRAGSRRRARQYRGRGGREGCRGALRGRAGVPCRNAVREGKRQALAGGGTSCGAGGTRHGAAPGPARCASSTRPSGSMASRRWSGPRPSASAAQAGTTMYPSSSASTNTSRVAVVQAARRHLRRRVKSDASSAGSGLLPLVRRARARARSRPGAGGRPRADRTGGF